jgi:hypothetical protein
MGGEVLMSRCCGQWGLIVCLADATQALSSIVYFHITNMDLPMS